jgi:hypothetical protein
MPELIPSQSLGSMFAQNLGSGLGAGIQDLVEHKLNEVKGIKFWKSLNLPDDIARSFASAPEKMQRDLLERIEGIKFGAISNQGQQSQQQQMQGQPQQQQLDQQGQPIPQSSQQLGQQPAQQEGGFTLGPTKEERRHRETITQQKELAQHAAAKDIIHESNQKAKAAKEDLRDIDRLEELQNSGKLDSPGFHEFLTRSGLDVSALRSPESEEFQKIQANFLRNAKNYFGARVTDKDIEYFLKTIPTLSNSNEGRARIFANLKRIARGADEYNEALNEVIKENKGVPPFNFEYEVGKRVDKRLDRIAEEFRKDLAKPIPKEQNKYIAALQAGAGKLAGNLGKGALGAVGGAYLGSRVGPAGVIPGAIGGGIAGLTGASVKDFYQ